MNRNALSALPRLLAATLAALLLALLGACASTQDKDVTASWPAQKLYDEAMDKMDSGAYDTAIQYFEKLESRYPYGTLAQQALIEVAYGHYKQDERTEALAACDRFLKTYPDNPATDYVLYLKGRINFYASSSALAQMAGQNLFERDQAAAKDAFDSFKLLSTRYPNSTYTPDALMRMRYILNSLGQYESQVALFYFRKGAYVAAADRAQRAVQNYPDAPSAELALALMMDSYDKLGLTKLRDDSERVLKQNFPHSAYLGGTLPQTHTAWWALW